MRSNILMGYNCIAEIRDTLEIVDHPRTRGKIVDDVHIKIKPRLAARSRR